MVWTITYVWLTLNSETSWLSKNYLTVHYFVLASLISRSLQRSSFIPCLCQTSHIFMKVRVEDAGVILWILTCCVWHFDCLTWMRSGQSLFRSGTLRIFWLADIINDCVSSRAGIARSSRLFTTYMGKLVHDSIQRTQNSGLVNFLRKTRLPFAQISQFHLPKKRLGKPETDRFKWVWKMEHKFSFGTFRPRKQDLTLVYHLQKVSGKTGWKVNGRLVFPDGIFQTKTRIPFLQSHLWYQFQAFEVVSGKWNLFVQMVNAIPGRNLPVLKFAYTICLNRGPVCPCNW